jgi:signal transduction histidine kinase
MSGIAQYAEARPHSDGRLVSRLSISVTICAATIAAVVIVLSRAPTSTETMALPVFLLGAASMFGLALTDIAQARELRFAWTLIAAGVLWSLSALTASHDSLAYTVGHISQWCVDVAIAYLLLSYPFGRLTGGAERALFAATAATVGLLFVPTALFGQFPHPSLWSNCTAHCPRNVFSLTTSTPAVVRDGVLPIRDILAVALFAAITAVALRRDRRAEPLLGQLHLPIAALAALQALVFAVYFPLRAAAPSSEALAVVSWLFVLSLPAVGLACGTGRLYRRLQVGIVLERMTRELIGSATPADVRLALARALQDPSLRILHSFPGDGQTWVDESGFPEELPSPLARERVTNIASGRWRIAILHHRSSPEDRPLVLSAGTYALATLENQRLTDELRGSLSLLSETRASRLSAEQDARQRIERDLHDGAQQRLVALRVKLGLVASNLEDRDVTGAANLRALEDDVDATIDEVRSLARGIYPALLARTGLREALRGLGRGAALPTMVCADGVGRYPAEIETTVYFSCSEALQNAAKHAETATGVRISVWQEDGDLHFEASDDGVGFDPASTPPGAGLTNLSERLAAVGGTMTIRSIPGHGTVLGGSMPLP